VISWLHPRHTSIRNAKDRKRLLSRWAKPVQLRCSPKGSATHSNASFKLHLMCTELSSRNSMQQEHVVSFEALIFLGGFAHAHILLLDPICNLGFL